MAQPSARLRRPSCPANELKNVPALGTLNTRCEMGELSDAPQAPSDRRRLQLNSM
jgi:hypothetical protein